MNLSHDETIGYPTTVTSRMIIRFLHIHLKPFNITPEQWTVLRSIAENHDGLTQKQISFHTDKDKATITRILEVLERKALITKQSNHSDKRSIIIYITSTGTELINQLKPFIHQLFEERVLQGISPLNLDIYKHVLLQMDENIRRDLSNL